MACKTKQLQPHHVYLEIEMYAINRTLCLPKTNCSPFSLLFPLLRDTDQRLGGDPPSPADLKELINNSMQSLFGNSSTTMPADLLTFDEESQRAIIRCHSDDSGQIWAALTCIRSYNDRACAVRVSRSTGWLTCLASNDRAWQSEL